MKTLLLTQKDVEKVLTPTVANDTVEKAFRAYGMRQAEMPAKSYLYFSKGDLRSMPAYLHAEGFDVAGVKCVTVHPQNQNMAVSRRQGMCTCFQAVGKGSLSD